MAVSAPRPTRAERAAVFTVLNMVFSPCCGLAPVLLKAMMGECASLPELFTNPPFICGSCGGKRKSSPGFEQCAPKIFLPGFLVRSRADTDLKARRRAYSQNNLQARPGRS